MSVSTSTVETRPPREAVPPAPRPVPSEDLAEQQHGLETEQRTEQIRRQAELREFGPLADQD